MPKAPHEQLDRECWCLASSATAPLKKRRTLPRSLLKSHRLTRGSDTQPVFQGGHLSAPRNGQSA